MTAPPAVSQTKGLASAALIVGIVAFITGLVPVLGLTLGLIAVVLGVLSLMRGQSKGFAITGAVLGSVALITGLLVTITFFSVLGSRSETGTSPAAAAVEESVPPAEVEASEAAPAEAAPAPEPVTPEAPPAATGSVESPYPQPYTAKGLLGGEKYILTGRVVDANANGLVAEWNQFNSQAPAGFKYVVVELTMAGLDPDGVEPSLAEWDLSLATSEGNRYDSEFIIFGDGMPSMSDGPTLYPGSSFTGYTAYIVPEAAQSFLLYDNGNFVAFS